MSPSVNSEGRGVASISASEPCYAVQVQDCGDGRYRMEDVFTRGVLISGTSQYHNSEVNQASIYHVSRPTVQDIIMLGHPVTQCSTKPEAETLVSIEGTTDDGQL